MRDTTPDAEAVRLETIRRTAPSERLRQALEWSESVRTLALARLRERHPGLTSLELVELLLGERLIPHGSAGRSR